MPPFWSLFVIVLPSLSLLSAAPPMERITNKDNHGHMISSTGLHNSKARENTRRVACSALSAITKAHSCSPPLYLSPSLSISLSFFSGAEKGSKDRKIAGLWRDVQCVMQHGFCISRRNLSHIITLWNTGSSRAPTQWRQHSSRGCNVGNLASTSGLTVA